VATLAQEVLDQMVLSDDTAEEDSRYASQLPEPRGYKLLIALPEVDEATEGGIIKSAQSQHEESIATVAGFVMSMGPDRGNKTKRISGSLWPLIAPFLMMNMEKSCQMSVIVSKIA
jgi:hypothetical protein